MLSQKALTLVIGNFGADKPGNKTKDDPANDAHVFASLKDSGLPHAAELVSDRSNWSNVARALANQCQKQIAFNKSKPTNTAARPQPE
jgi:hypothetical protein